MVRMLVSAHANVDQARTDNCATPMHVATVKGHADVINALAAAGADLHAADSKGITPLEAALRWGTPEAVAALRAAGATR